MRMHILAAGVAAVALFPSLAFAQATCEQQHNNRVVGTVAGGGIGAVVGSAVAGRGDRTTGAVIGAIGGAIIGNQLTKPNSDCAHAYGYYDQQGAWHTNAVERSAAAGYYDRNGQWVDGAPNGYYDANGVWMAADSRPDQSGYYDSDGRYVPASANGYYNSGGQWVASAASGYYDQNGRWMAGSATGHYDANGRWINGAANGHRDSQGAWVADAQPGYYDSNSHWHAGAANGYYDGGGRWISTSGTVHDMRPDRGDAWSDAPRDIHAREAWLEQRIHLGQSSGQLSRYTARRAMTQLNTIRERETHMHHRNGDLSRRDEASLQRSLDNLTQTLQQRM